MIREDCIIGKGTVIWNEALVNLYGCRIGDDCNVGAYAEIGPGVVIGDRVRVGAHSFIPEGVTIEDDVFIGPRVTFCNDKYPPSGKEYWGLILVKRRASIGAGAIILPGVTIEEDCLIGAGSIVTKDVRPGCLMAGNPAIFKRPNHRERKIVHG